MTSLRRFSLNIATAVVAFALVSSITGQQFSSVDADMLLRDLEQAETEKAFWKIADLFKRNGIDVADKGQWKLSLQVRDFKEIINDYENSKVTIRVSRMMKRNEVREYWENWSKVLAGGNFDQNAFFKDDEERFLLANYNVLILSAHELGHYVDFHFNISDRSFPGSLTTHDPLNCTEGYADRFAVGTANLLAADSRFSALRSRYSDLIKAFNAAIPAKNRFNFDSPDFISSRCGEADLLENGLNDDKTTVNENFFRQYASAYFNRHRLMLEDRSFGDLSKVAGRDLWDVYLGLRNPIDTRFRLTTLSEFSGAFDRDIFLAGDQIREMIEFDAPIDDMIGGKDKTKSVNYTLRQLFLDSRGSPKVLEITWTSKGERPSSANMILNATAFAVNILNANGKKFSTTKIKIPNELRNEYNISNFVSLNSSDFILVLTPFHLEKKYDHVVLVMGSTKGESARVKRFSLPGLKDADEIGAGFFVTPTGKLRLVRIEKNEDKAKSVFTHFNIDRHSFRATLIKPGYTVDLSTNSLTNSKKNGLWRDFDEEYGIFGNDSGDIYFSGNEGNMQSFDDANIFYVSDKPRLVLGSINGRRDGKDLRTARLTYAIAPRFVDENRFLFIDRFNGFNYVREVTLMPEK